MTCVRNSTRLGYLALLIAMTVSCASDPSQQSTNRERFTKDDPSKGIICTNEVPIGSSLRERKCTTPEQREAQRRDSEHKVVIEPGRGNAR